MSTSKWGVVAAAWMIGTFTGTAAQATVTPFGSSLVSAVVSYTEFGGASGDVIVQLASNNPSNSSCPGGFWVKGGDIGAKNAFTQILAAYHTGLPVTIYADPAQMWTGNSSRACLVMWVQS